MSDRDEVQVARWSAIKSRVGASLRELRLNDAGSARSQARLAGELEELGYHVTQSMVSRYEQGLLDAPLTLERMVGWALCCEGLSSVAFRDLLSLAGYYLPWNDADLQAFDDLLRSYRRLSLADQVVVRAKLLWHILGIEASGPGVVHAHVVLTAEDTPSPRERQSMLRLGYPPRQGLD